MTAQVIPIVKRWLAIRRKTTTVSAIMSAEPYRPGERRPIASREKKGSQLVAGWLATKGVSPNAISVAGMIAGIAAGVAFSFTAIEPEFQRPMWLLGAIFVQLRLLANMFDGMVAVATQKASPIGELYNEVPDRISDAAVLIGLGYALGGDVVLGYAATCAAFLTAYVRAVGKVAGGTQEFCGPMAKQQRMFLCTMLGIYNCVAPAAWQGPHGQWGLAAVVLGIIIIGSLFTGVRRLSRTARALKNLHA
jgi:phosphatidylglycerophosphate synthase